MKSGKWSNFWGAVCATATLGTVYVSVKRVRKKYGIVHVSSLLDYRKIGNYALDKFLFDNDRFLEKIVTKLPTAENTETEC